MFRAYFYILLFSATLFSDIYLIPDETELLLYKLKKDFRDAKQVDIITQELSEKKIFRILVKFLNRDSTELNLILDPNKNSLIYKLSIYQGINIKTLSGIREAPMNLNFILIDNSILYIFSNSFSKIALNQSYGTVLRFKARDMIKRFMSIFTILTKRSSMINNLR